MGEVVSKLEKFIYKLKIHLGLENSNSNNMKFLSTTSVPRKNHNFSTSSPMLAFSHNDHLLILIYEYGIYLTPNYCNIYSLNHLIKLVIFSFIIIQHNSIDKGWSKPTDVGDVNINVFRRNVVMERVLNKFDIVQEVEIVIIQHLP